ncbi:MAG: aminotransferase class I/II-fold pyridoxal phosphate-dependent enzyme [Anaerocolumna sp.]
MNLYDLLLEYSNMDYYPMHMPGHKRNTALLNMVNPYTIDITEIEGFDNLHHAEGILLKGMERAANLYGSKHTSYLIGGSTSGILTGISACTQKGDKILVARNAHKSVYHAIYLNELEPVYIYPPREPGFGVNGGIFPEIIEELLIKHPDIKLVMITSPTYEGIVSDVKTIAETAHRYGVPLMVDEAHGAHLGFHPGFPAGSVSLGADIVIHSIHKTLPAFTQSALIHVNGELVDYEEIQRYLSIYQSTSPSYLLMAGIEQCIALLEQKKDELFTAFDKRLHLFYSRMEQLKHLKILTGERVKASGFYALDPSKITVSVKNTNITGNDLYNCLLNPHKIQMEMVSKDYVLGMTSIADTEEGFKRLGDALLEVDRNIKHDTDKKIDTDKKMNADENRNRGSYTNKDTNISSTTNNTSNINSLNMDKFPENTEPPERVMLSNDAYRRPYEVILLSESIGRITTEYIYLYPPGIPLLVPGERITKALLLQIAEYQQNGLFLQGLQDVEGKYIKVVTEM